MKKILLLGNPNVGKSVIFSRLTGSYVVASNYPGTTVEFTRGFMKLWDKRVEVLDLPGVYTLDATSRAEEVAAKMIEEGDLIINIIDATNLERNLDLTMELLEKNTPIIVALNMWDETEHRGVKIDVEKLERLLCVPVIPTCGITGDGIKELVGRIEEACNPTYPKSSHTERWAKIGAIVEQVQTLSHRHHTWIERLQDASTNPWSGLPMAGGVIFLTFQLVRFMGGGLIDAVELLFEKLYAPLLMRLSTILGGGGFLHDVLIGELKMGEIDFLHSLGLMSTGVYIPIGVVLPYVSVFYLILSFLEDLGYLPRIAILTDGLMHRFGLHGYAVIPMILGLGCNVPGVLSTRILEGRGERFIAITLMSIAIPCMAQIAVIVGLVGERGGKYLLLVFSILTVIWLILGCLLKKFVRGINPEILIEIPPYRAPHPGVLFKKLWMRILSFLREALPFVFISVFILNALHSLKTLDFALHPFSIIIRELLGLPDEAIAPLIVGFFRKDVAVGMLAPLNLTTKQLVIGSVTLAIYFPCIATFVVLIRELGIRDMVKSALVMIGVAFLVGTSLNLLL